MSPTRSAAITRGLVKTFLPLHRAFRRQRFALRLLARFSPVVAYYDVYPTLSEELQREWAELDTFDSLTDQYKHFRTVHSLESTLRSLGLADVVCFRHGGVVIARGRRPSESRTPATTLNGNA
jgi:hypothetical protein